MTEVFLDTSSAIALSNSNDQYHNLAIKLATKLEQSKTRLLTTRAVILEIGNALAKQRYRHAAIELLESLENDTQVEIIEFSKELYKKAFYLYRERPDKEWGLTDSISFTVMKERGMTDALTTDAHFEQAGFQILLKN